MRHFLFLSALFCAGAVSALASVDTGLLALVPPGAKIIGAVDITQARNSEFGQYLLMKAQTEDDHFQEMIDETGFDPRRDLQSVLFATSGPSGTAAQPSSFAILARGNFDQNRIKAAAMAKGGVTIVNYGGVDMIVHSKESGQQTAIGFLDVGVAVMADANTLKQMIDSRAAPTTLDSDLKSKINSVGGANDAWFVSLVSGGSFLADHAGPQGASQAKALQGVLQSSGGVKLGSTVETTFDAVTRSPQDAQSLSDVIRFMASMVQMQRQKDPRAGILASSLDGMTLQNSGTSVHVALSMPEKTLEQLADAGPLGAAH
jgi:hypothetical protein